MKCGSCKADVLKIEPWNEKSGECDTCIIKWQDAYNKMMEECNCWNCKGSGCFLCEEEDCG
jgi:hypothetical protein